MDELEGSPVRISAEDLPNVLSVPPKKYEYLDHTADVQIFVKARVGPLGQFSWGDDLKEAFEQAAVGMFGYMTEIESVDIIMEDTVEVDGDDLINLLYHFLDEWLYKFSAEPFFIARKVVITEFDLEKFHIKATGFGEEFSLAKHPQGTEVKAITYSNLQVHNKDGQHEVYVIVDI